MTRHRTLTLAFAFVLPGALAAQSLRVGIEPHVGALPGTPLWREQSTRFDQAAGPQALEMTLRRTVDVARDPMALFGARITLARVGSPWRLVVDGGGGSTRLHATQREYDRVASPGGFAISTTETDMTLGQDVTILQLGLRLERVGRWKRMATELGAGAMLQQLRTHEETNVLTSPTLPPAIIPVASHRYLDPGLVLGGAIGPATGMLSGLRLSVRSAHVWRDADVPNDFVLSPYTQLNAKSRAWQWQPEVSLGWRMWLGDE